MKSRALYGIEKRASCVLMILALLWLTISLPFVNNSRAAATASMERTGEEEQPFSQCEEKNATGATEEKSSGSGSIGDEYLHNHHHRINHPQPLWSAMRQSDDEFPPTYVSELLSPPPEIFN